METHRKQIISTPKLKSKEMEAHMQKLQRAADLFNNEQFAEAEPLCRELIAAVPGEHQAFRILGACLRNLERIEESIENLRAAVDLEPTKGIYLFELGVSLKEAGRPQEAMDSFHKCDEMQPEIWQASSNIGSILDGFGRHKESLEWSMRAQRRAPDQAICHYNVGNSQMGLGHIDSARLSFQRTIEIDPEHAKAHWNLALCHLLKGDYRDGWQEHEWRERAEQVKFDKYPQPLWNGEPIPGKTLLIHAEQGIGDETLFASCFPEAIDRVGECVIVCEPRLTPLFIRSFPNAMVYGVSRKSNHQPPDLPEKIDYQIPAGSLPQYFRNEWSDFPDRQSYLVADKKKTAMWRERFDALGPGLKVGISWRTGGLPASRRTRVTSLAQWGHLFDMPGVQWINLQYGEVSGDIEAERERSGTVIHDWDDGDPLVDLDGFASRLDALDLVISAGNATAHLAGALGVETWALLPHPPTWRWLLSGETIPWYPSVTALRQEQQGDWSPVFRQLGNMLSERLGVPAPTETPTIAAAFEEDINFVGPDGIPLIKDNVRAYCEKANALQQEGKFREAEEICRLVLNHFPRDPMATNLIAVIAVRENRPQAAIRHLLRTLRLIPDDILVNLNLANAYRKTEQFENAIRHYEKAVKLKPDLIEGHVNLGVTYATIGRDDLARESYLKALEVDPNLEAAKANLARLEQRSPAAPHFPTNAAGAPGLTSGTSMPTQPS